MHVKNIEEKHHCGLEFLALHEVLWTDHLAAQSSGKEDRVCFLQSFSLLSFPQSTLGAAPATRRTKALQLSAHEWSDAYASSLSPISSQNQQ